MVYIYIWRKSEIYKNKTNLRSNWCKILRLGYLIIKLATNLKNRLNWIIIKFNKGSKFSRFLNLWN